MTGFIIAALSNIAWFATSMIMNIDWSRHTEELEEEIKMMESRKKGNLGRWYKTIVGKYEAGGGTRESYVCSECHEHANANYRFCPNCGMEMEEYHDEKRR